MNDRLYEKITVSHSSDAKSSYLMMQVKKDEELYRHQIATLTKNPVHSILRFNVVTKDDTTSLCYDITSKQTLAQVLKRKKFNKSEVTDILLKISRVIINCDNYFLHEDNFLLHEDYIYIIPATLDVSLVYIPVKLPGKQLNTEFHKLVNKLITNIDNTNYANSDFVHSTLVEINKEHLNISQFAEYLAKVAVGERSKESSNQPSRSGDYKPADIIKADVEVEPKLQLEETNKKVHVEKAAFQRKESSPFRYRESENRGVEAKSNKTLLIILVQVLILIGLSLIILETDLVVEQTGLDLRTLTALLILAGAGDVYIVRKIQQGPGFNPSKEKMDKQNQSKVKEKQLPKPIKQDKRAEEKSSSVLTPVIHERVQEFDSGDFATELINADLDSKKEAYITFMLNGRREQRKVDNNSFIFGKLSGQVDFLIENKSVSRVHAEICKDKDVFYIVDLNSKNGTYLNGEKLQSNKRYQLKNNDILRFAHEEYTFIQ